MTVSSLSGSVYLVRGAEIREEGKVLRPVDDSKKDLCSVLAYTF